MAIAYVDPKPISQPARQHMGRPLMVAAERREINLRAALRAVR
jgi:hypothetical protein